MKLRNALLAAAIAAATVAAVPAAHAETRLAVARLYLAIDEPALARRQIDTILAAEPDLARAARANGVIAFLKAAGASE